MYEIIITLISAIAYIFLFWLPKKVRLKDPEDIDPKKIIKTLLIGLGLGIVLLYMDLSPTLGNMETWLGLILGHSVLIAIIDKVTIFIYRILLMASAYYQALS